MTSGLVCASCRRNLLRNLSRGIRTKAGTEPRSTPSAPSNANGTYKDRTNEEIEEGEQQDTSRHGRVIPHQERLRSVEDDFVERLLQSRDPKKLNGPYSKYIDPNYSRTRRKRLDHDDAASRSPISWIQHGFTSTSQDQDGSKIDPYNGNESSNGSDTGKIPLVSQVFAMSPTPKNSKDVSNTAEEVESLPDKMLGQLYYEDSVTNHKRPELRSPSIFGIHKGRRERYIGRKLKSQRSESEQAIKEALVDPKVSASDACKLFFNFMSESQVKRVFVSDDLVISLLRKVANSWCKDPASPENQTPSSTIKGINPVNMRQLAIEEALKVLLSHAVTLTTGEVAQTPKEYMENLRKELVSTWDCFLVFAQCKVNKTNHFNRVWDWKLLIDSDEMLDVRRGKLRRLFFRFFHFFPRAATHISPAFDTFVLLTIVVLQRFSQGVNKSKRERTFEKFLIQLLPYSDVLERISLHEKFLIDYGVPIDVTEKAIEELKQILTNAVTLNVLHDAESVEGLSSDDSSLQQSTVEMFKKRVNRAVATQDHGRLGDLWKETVAYYQNSSYSTESKRIPIEVYASFLDAFMKMRRQNRAIDVWNHMISSGLTPNIVAWTTMLQGCGIARDPKALELMWQDMIESGISPDVQAWTTRIHVLATSGHWQSGIYAFEDMLNRWKNAVQLEHGSVNAQQLASIGDIQGSPKPNVLTLNALVTGLARGRRYEELGRVLAQAQSIGIEPDTHTFNPLFRTALADGDTSLAVKLLEQMQATGLSPDIATFTMILNSSFTNANPNSSELSSAPPYEKLLLEMERFGLEPTTWTYTTLINGLLKDSVSSKDLFLVVQAVMDRMQHRGIPMASSIYTTLITHHFNFSSGTPDIAAIDALWNRAQKDKNVHLDVVFYDRLIEGFARYGKIGRMSSALLQATKKGRTPSYRAMTEVVKALGAVKEWEIIQQLVNGVKKDEEARDQPRSRVGRDEFWTTVTGMGMNVNSVEENSQEESNSSAI